MENSLLIGIKKFGSINWYEAHSMNRRPDGALVAFANDDRRTAAVIPAREFAGVRPLDSHDETPRSILEILKPVQLQ